MSNIYKEMNRHKWLKKDKFSTYHKFDDKISGFDLRECINCGLKKMTVKSGFSIFSTVYFITNEKGELVEDSIKMDTLPFTCDFFAKVKTGKQELLEDELFDIKI